MKVGIGYGVTILSLVCLHTVAKATIVLENQSFVSKEDQKRYYYINSSAGVQEIKRACAAKEVQNTLNALKAYEGYRVTNVWFTEVSAVKFQISNDKETLEGEMLISGSALSQYDHNSRKVVSEGCNCHMIPPEHLVNTASVFKVGSASIAGTALPVAKERHVSGGRYQ